MVVGGDDALPRLRYQRHTYLTRTAPACRRCL